jgi:hypothetical protein
MNVTESPILNVWMFQNKFIQITAKGTIARKALVFWSNRLKSWRVVTNYKNLFILKFLKLSFKITHTRFMKTKNQSECSCSHS